MRLGIVAFHFREEIQFRTFIAEACNQVRRNTPLQKFSPSVKKRVGHSLKSLDIVQKFGPLSENSLPRLVSQAGCGPFLHVTSHVILKRKLLQNRRHFDSLYAANRSGNVWWNVGFPLFGIVIFCCFIIDASVIQLALHTDAWEVCRGCANYWNFRFDPWKSFGFYLYWISFNDSRHSLRFVGRSRVCPDWWWVERWHLRGGFIFWKLSVSLKK